MKDYKFEDLDRLLQSCIDKGIKARLDGLSKYENVYDPGSLSFDAWDSGWKMADNDFNPPQ